MLLLVLPVAWEASLHRGRGSRQRGSRVSLLPKCDVVPWLLSPRPNGLSAPLSMSVEPAQQGRSLTSPA